MDEFTKLLTKRYVEDKATPRSDKFRRDFFELINKTTSQSIPLGESVELLVKLLIECIDSHQHQERQHRMYEYNSFHERKALHSLMDGLAGVDGTFASMLNLIRQLHDRWMKAAEDVRAASQLLKESLSVSIEQNEWRAKAKMRIDASESEDYSTAMSIPSCSFRGAFQSGKWIGECVWDSGAQYFGGIADGSYQGLGTWTGANGHTYTGEFVDGNRNGLGHYQFPDGQTYVGQHVANSASGYGRWTFPDGRTYTGEMRDGLFHGKGELFHPFSRGGGGTTDYGFFEKGKYIGRMPPEGKEPWNEEAASPI